jgi:hypothetical protein
LLDLDEIFDKGLAYLDHSQHFEERGILLEESDPSEIRAAVIEMCDRIQGEYIEATDLAEKRFRLNKRFGESKKHGVIKAKIAEINLRSVKDS